MRVEDREPEQAVVPQRLVVLEADEHAGPADARIGEAEPDAEPERIGEKDEQKDRRRQHEQQADDSLCSASSGQRRLAPCSAAAAERADACVIGMSSVCSGKCRAARIAPPRIGSDAVVAVGPLLGALGRFFRRALAGGRFRHHVDHHVVRHRRGRGVAERAGIAVRAQASPMRACRARAPGRRSRSGCRSCPSAAGSNRRSNPRSRRPSAACRA